MMVSRKNHFGTGRLNQINLKRKPPKLETDQSHVPYMLRVEDVFSIHGEGCIVTGILKGGRLSAGDHIRIIRADGSQKIAKAETLKVFSEENLEKAEKAVFAESDTRVGIWIRDVSVDEIPVGCVIRGEYSI